MCLFQNDAYCSWKQWINCVRNVETCSLCRSCQAKAGWGHLRIVEEEQRCVAKIWAQCNIYEKAQRCHNSWQRPWYTCALQADQLLDQKEKSLLIQVLETKPVLKNRKWQAGIKRLWDCLYQSVILPWWINYSIPSTGCQLWYKTGSQ